MLHIWRLLVNSFLHYQIYATFDMLLQFDGDNFFDFCGEGWEKFFLLHFPPAIEGVVV